MGHCLIPDYLLCNNLVLPSNPGVWYGGSGVSASRLKDSVGLGEDLGGSLIIRSDKVQCVLA